MAHSNTVVVLSSGELEEIIAKVVKNCLDHLPTPNPSRAPEIIDSKAVCQRLGISAPTLNKYREKGRIPFLVIGDAIRYNYHEVIEALKSKTK